MSIERLAKEEFLTELFTIFEKGSELNKYDIIRALKKLILRWENVL